MQTKMRLESVKITNRDSCKTYALKRIGLEKLLNFNDDTPTIKDLYTTRALKHIESPEVGCILVWKTENGKEQYWNSIEIDSNSRVTKAKMYTYGHCAVYEGDGFISEVRITEDNNKRIVSTIGLKRYADVRKPDYILRWQND